MKKQCSILKNKGTRYFVVILLLLGISSRVNAQFFINEGACLPDTIDMGSFVIGTAVTPQTITAQDFEDAAPTMAFVPNSIRIVEGPVQIDEATFTAITSMSFAFASPTVTLTGTTVPLTSAGVTLSFTISVNDAAEPACTRIFKMKIVRNPIDLLFVLDISGSMSSPVDPTCVGVGCRSKIQELKDAVSLFFDRGLATGSFTASDKVGVIYFETAVDNTDATLVSWDPSTNISTLQSHVNARALGGLTNMNGGLGAAAPGAITAGRKKFIVLFTDGMQNVNPLVTSTGGANPTVTIGGTAFSSATANTKIYTIGLNAPSGAVYSMLGDIAHATNGISYYNTTPAGNPDATFALNESFMNSFINILVGSSPQLVDYRYKVANGQTGIVENFTINKGAAKVILEYSSTAGGNSDANISVFKDSVDVTRLGHVTFGNGYRLFSIDLPKRLPIGDTIRSEGVWQLRVRNHFGAYQVSAIADDHRLKYTCSIGNKVYTVGDTLALSVTLALATTPIKDAGQVTAIVLKPGDDWGDILAKTAFKQTDTSGADPVSAAQAKGAGLLSDSAYFSKLLPAKQVVTLTNNNDGTYKGNFTATDLTGPYRIIFLIKGQNSALGNYERMETFSTMFNFGRIDLVNSIKTKTWIGDTLTLNFTPKNTFNKLLGPDYDSRIKVTPTPNKVIDHLDGSYTYVFFNTPESSDPQITITINGEEFFNDKASVFGEDKPHGSFYMQWWFWVLLLVIILILFFLFKKKNP